MDSHAPQPTSLPPPQNPVILKHDPMVPVGDHPFWERDNIEEGNGPLHTIADSLVLLKSLRQSRERLLLHTFPKFSGKGRSGKASEPAVHPKQHSIQTRGRCDVYIGPHIFPDTTFFEVHYLPASVPISNVTTSWQSQTTSAYRTPYSYTTATLPYPSKDPGSSSLASTTIAPAPLVSELASDPSVTPSLINQVNIAASTNPTLSNLLHLAAAKEASQAQLETLAVFIRSLAGMGNSLALSNQATSITHPTTTPGYYRSPTQMTLPIKEFDIVLEYRETPNDKWVLSRTCHPVATRVGQDVELTIAISNTGQTPAVHADTITKSEEAVISEIPVMLRLKDAPYALWDTIVRWIGGVDKMNGNKQYLEDLSAPRRLYPGLQLSAGPTLTQLQVACAPPYTMRLLKQGPSYVRPSRQKPKTGQKRSNASKLMQESTVQTKKARISQAKPPTPVPVIQCLSCKQPDVPLILGGRFCRPCVEAGKATPIPTQPAPAVQTSPM